MPAFTITKDRHASDAVAGLLAALPEWFGIESANAAYVDAARRLPTYLATDADFGVVGALLVDRHFPTSAEIHLLLVHPARHRRGIGRALLAAAEADLAADGVVLLEVKTLGPSHPDEGYALTRRFYAAVGFLPVEELSGVWPGNPCLVMVKTLT